jgi:hypothetical protein
MQRLRFAVRAYTATPELQAAGVVFANPYETVRGGRMIYAYLPEGTIRLKQLHPSGGYGAYRYKSTDLYRLPNGSLVRAGGGGPSDADIIELVPEVPA